MYQYCYFSLPVMVMAMAVQVPHNMEQNPDSDIIANLKILTEATKTSITLTLTEIQTLIYEQTRFAGALLDPPCDFGQVMGRLSFSYRGKSVTLHGTY